MKRLVPVLMGVAVVGCTISVEPIKAKRIPPRHAHHARVKPKTSSSLIVDSDWLVQYRKLEQEHGDYRLADDNKVEAVGNGKYKVTPAMMNHFRDLIQAPETPAPPANP